MTDFFWLMEGATGHDWEAAHAIAGVGTEPMVLRAVLCGHKCAHGTFAKEAGADSWRLYDGPPANVGDWPAVLAACRVKRLQPLALFYDTPGW